MRFLPHVTVATLIERNGRFLLVEEMRDGRLVINQPAGHLEADESLPEAAVREVLEETGWQVELTGVVGIYLFRGADGVTYHRTCFAARPLQHLPDHPLDSGIIRALWLTPDELAERQSALRSPLVLQCIHDYLQKPIYPMDLIR